MQKKDRLTRIVGLIIIAVMLVVAFISIFYVVVSLTTLKTSLPTGTSDTVIHTSTGGVSSFPGNLTGSPLILADYTFFIAPNQQRLELVRQWLMTPPDYQTQRAGYDPSIGLVGGGYWPGYSQYSDGWHNGFVLIDSNLLLGKSLDYLNQQKGLTTYVESNTMRWLANTTFVNPATGQNSSYQGNDRREILFGNIEPCVMLTSGQVYYAPGHLLNDSEPITTAIPTTCAPTTGVAMEIYVPWIELYYLEGNVEESLQMFDSTLNGWSSTEGTGVGGSTGGYFNATLDQGSCKNSRSLSLWIHMARATGFWDSSIKAETVAGQVQNQLWALQLVNGGISSSYSGCGTGNVTPESSGETILAYDPRVLTWFHHVNGTTSQQLSVSDSTLSLVEAGCWTSLVAITDLNMIMDSYEAPSIQLKVS